MSRRRAGVIATALAPLVLASLGPLIGHGWLGHGLYKVALLLLPFAFGASLGRPAAPGGRNLLLALGTGAGLGLLAFAALSVILPLMVEPGAVREGFDARYGYTPVTAILAAVLIMSVNSLLEEWFYRGTLDSLTGPGPSALVFGAQHTIVLTGIGGFLPALVAGACVVPAGLIWSRLYARGNGILLPFASHMATDLVLLGGGLHLLGYL